MTVGDRTGVRARAEALVGDLRVRLARVAAAAAGRPRPAVALVEWVDPPFNAGHWIPDLITAAGGEPVAARPGIPSVETTWDDDRRGEARPRHRLALRLTTSTARSSRPSVVDQGAARRCRSGRSTPTASSSGQGRALVDGVEAIASILHPDAVPPSAAVQRVTAPG